MPVHLGWKSLSEPVSLDFWARFVLTSLLLVSKKSHQVVVCPVRSHCTDGVMIHRVLTSGDGIVLKVVLKVLLSGYLASSKEQGMVLIFLRRKSKVAFEVNL